MILKTTFCWLDKLFILYLKKRFTKGVLSVIIQLIQLSFNSFSLLQQKQSGINDLIIFWIALVLLYSHVLICMVHIRKWPEEILRKKSYAEYFGCNFKIISVNMKKLREMCGSQSTGDNTEAMFNMLERKVL